MSEHGGFTDSERAVDLDGSLTAGRIELELRLMAGTRRMRAVIPPATFTDGSDKPADNVTILTDVWDGEQFIDRDG